jgi:hypothetical protein
LLGFAVNGGLVLVTGALGKPGNETFARQFMRHANAA